MKQNNYSTKKNICQKICYRQSQVKEELMYNLKVINLFI